MILYSHFRQKTPIFRCSNYTSSRHAPSTQAIWQAVSISTDCFYRLKARRDEWSVGFKLCADEEDDAGQIVESGE